MKRVIAAALLAAALVGCSTATDDSASGVDAGLGSKDASSDVTLGKCKTQLGGVIECDLTIVNPTDGASDYYVEASIIDSDGANVGTANAIANGVQPGQTAKAELTGVATGPAKNVDTIKITTVQRTAS